MKRGTLSNSLLAARLYAGLKTKGMRSKADTKKIVFVIGTGRSGTHFLTRCLIGSDQLSDLTGGKENPLVFRTITAAALDRTHREILLGKARHIYDGLASVARPAWLVDQSHPNIWFAEHWSAVYPLAHFVGIVRNPYSVVASMMKHRDVSAWALQWKQFPIPNPFLGITAGNAVLYGEMSLAQRSALRWISHYRRLCELKKILGDKLSIVVYEDLCRDPRATLAAVAQRLEIGGEFRLPRIDQAAVSRGSDMSPEDIRDIRRLLAGAKVEEQWLQPPW